MGVNHVRLGGGKTQVPVVPNVPHMLFEGRQAMVQQSGESLSQDHAAEVRGEAPEAEVLHRKIFKVAVSHVRGPNRTNRHLKVSWACAVSGSQLNTDTALRKRDRCALGQLTKL